MMAANRPDYDSLAKLSQGIRPDLSLTKRGADLIRGPNALSKLPNSILTNTWPETGSSLDLDFANNRGFVRGSGQGGAMDAVTFTRASSGNWVDNTGTLRTGAGTFTGTANALGNNLVPNPQNFENASWTKTNISVTTNTLASPDSTITAGTFSFSVSATNASCFPASFSIVSGTTYTFSVYAKQGSWKYFRPGRVTGSAFPAPGTWWFDLDAGTFNGSLSSGWTNQSITPVGNGWYRCSISATANANGSDSIGLVLTDASGNLTFTGSGNLFFWGAQLEVGASATTYYPTNINAPRFDWASTTQTTPTAGNYTATTTPANSQNLLTYSQDFSNAIWLRTAGTTINSTTVVAPDSTSTAANITINANTNTIYQLWTGTVVSGAYYVFSVYIKSSTNTTINIGTNGRTNSGNNKGRQFTITSSWQRYTYVLQAGANDTGLFVIVGTSDMSLVGGITPPINQNVTLDMWGAQLELAPSSMTPLVANSTCNGLLIEESRTNRILWCRDATQSNWTKTNVTAAKNQTGIDGVANSASTLTASANNGTCIQTITLASGSRTGSVYLKRITGTGNVQVTLDGSTWSTVDLSNGIWNRIVLSGTVTNPCVGVLLATSGDAVAMDYAQVEDGAFVTSPILTTTATATRATESASIGGANFLSFYNYTQWTIYVDGTPLPQDQFAALFAFDNGSGNQQCFYFQKSASALGTPGKHWLMYSLINTTLGNTVQCNILNNSAVVPSKVSFSYQRQIYGAAINGTLYPFVAGLTGTLVYPTVFWIGRRSDGAVWTGPIKRVIYNPRAVTNNSISALTGSQL